MTRKPQISENMLERFWLKIDILKMYMMCFSFIENTDDQN